MWRHGDVIIASADNLPADATLLPVTILARGEATGHSHRIEDPNAAEVYQSAQGGFLRVRAESTRLIHDEHKPIVLPRGLYRFWQQREYTPQAVRIVMD